jgi:molecular chaperone DnaJ
MNRDWVDKDFYKVLGVASDASADEIKRAYRKLAQQYHPDANQGDAAAEEKFKEISEAYATLSHAEQRKEYDQVRRLVESGGFAGFPGGGGGFGGFPGGGQRVRVEDLSDLLGGAGGLGDLFGFGGAGRRGGARKGGDTSAELHLSFEDAVHGVTTQVVVRGEALCTRCGGNGAEPGTHPDVCPRCGGTGTIARNQGFFSFAEPCTQCRGSGRIVETPCSACRGRGTEVRNRTIKVRIPPGVKDGSTIRLAGKGSPGVNGGPPGDLLVGVHVEKHPLFGRKGNDLTITVPVTFTEATLGSKVEVPTLNGPVTLKVPAGTPSGKTFRVKGRGVKPDRGRAGDLLVRVEVAVPRRLGRDEKKLLEQLATYETDDVRAHLKAV